VYIKVLRIDGTSAVFVVPIQTQPGEPGPAGSGRLIGCSTSNLDTDYCIPCTSDI